MKTIFGIKALKKYRFEVENQEYTHFKNVVILFLSIQFL